MIIVSNLNVYRALFMKNHMLVWCYILFTGSSCGVCLGRLFYCEVVGITCVCFG